MAFREYWYEQQAQKAAARQVVIEQAQGWIGCRVWCNVPGMRPTYGEVERIDEGGMAHIVVGYDRNDQPRYWKADVECLGHTVVFADA